MEEDPDIMNDLFLKIELLTAENKDIEAEEHNIDERINIIKSLQNKESMSNIDYKEFNPAEFQYNKNITSLVMKEVNNNLEEVVISYTPTDKANRVFVNGDFTFWEKKQMGKESNTENTFSIKLKLLKGFRYFYLFEVDGMKTCDFNKEIVENPITKETNNSLTVLACLENNKMLVDNSNTENSNSALNDIGTEINQVPINFNENLSQNRIMLEHNIKNQFTIKSLCPENELLSNICLFSSTFNERETLIANKREEYSNKIKNFYDNQIKEINEYSNEKLKDVLDYFRERVIKSENSLFIIKDIDYKMMNFKGVRLYDKNAVKVNVELHSKSRLWENISFLKAFEKSKIFDLEESKIIIEDYNKSNDVLKIYYQTLIISDNNYEDDGEEDESPDDHIGYSMNNNRMQDKEIVPYKILPEGVDINEYNLIIDKDTIVGVKTRDTGISVLFEAVLINSKNDNRKFSGFISTSMMKIYTCLYSKDIVNLIHIHLNDTSEEIAVDSVFMNPNESPEQFKEFKKDAFGKTLNYKFLFKDYRLNKIYYNLSDNFIDEPKFEEIRISVGNMIRIKNDEKFKGCYAKITSIPLGMLVRKDLDKKDIVERMKSSDIKKEGYCIERHLDELPGFIDIQVILNDKKEPILSKQKIKLSIPVCNAIIINMKEQVEIEKIVVTEQINEENILKDELDKLFLDLKSNEKYSDFQVLSKDVVSLDEAKQFLEYLEALNKDKFKELDLNDSEINDKLKFVFNLRDELVSNLHKLLRVLSFSKK